MLKTIKYFSYYLLFFLPLVFIGQTTFNIIPQPNQVSVYKGSFTHGGELLLGAYDDSLNKLLQYASDALRDEFNGKVKLVKSKSKANVHFFLNDKINLMAEGGYRLSVNNKGVTIIAAKEQGLFYGLQTLLQMLRTESEHTLRYVEIEDVPRFQWRAFMLDESRYFKGTAQVKKLLNEMARLKMNVFHWHLVDDHGWRIEIKKYPLLTEIGSKRRSTQVGPRKYDSPIQSGEPHEGFYTQNEIKEIVDYAADRHIAVIPEIEMPGHASSAIAAYSWLGPLNKEIEVPITFGVKEAVFNVADPRVYEFLTDVLDEVIAIFPSRVIHIGGDEARFEQWEKSEITKKYMKEKGLKTFPDLQVEFTNRISQYIESKGKKMMGWNEILGHNIHAYQGAKGALSDEELSKSSIVHFWRGDIDLMTEAAAKGYDIVNSLHTETYLDYSYEDISLRRAYDFNPIPSSLDAKYHDKIIGTGSQMWGEWIPTSGYMDFMIFPRIAAYAEVGWTMPKEKNFDQFLSSLSSLMETWKAKGIYHAPIEETQPVLEP